MIGSHGHCGRGTCGDRSSQLGSRHRGGHSLTSSKSLPRRLERELVLVGVGPASAVAVGDEPSPPPFRGRRARSSTPAAASRVGAPRIDTVHTSTDAGGRRTMPAIDAVIGASTQVRRSMGMSSFSARRVALVERVDAACKVTGRDELAEDLARPTGDRLTKGVGRCDEHAGRRSVGCGPPRRLRRAPQGGRLADLARQAGIVGLHRCSPQRRAAPRRRGGLRTASGQPPARPISNSVLINTTARPASSAPTAPPAT
jgi:hypothetical protein